MRQLKTKSFTEKKDGTARDIISAAAFASEWIPVPTELRKGGEIGFDMGDVKVRAEMVFDDCFVGVKMTSPAIVESEQHLYHINKGFFRFVFSKSAQYSEETDAGPATPECLKTARELLVGLFSDWMLLQCRKESIRERLSGFETYAVDFLANEKARIAPLKEQIRQLSTQSGELKRRFKHGELRQEQYLSLRQPIHKAIVALQNEAVPSNPFSVLFEEELSQCKFAKDKKTLIQSI